MSSTSPQPALTPSPVVPSLPCVPPAHTAKHTQHIIHMHPSASALQRGSLLQAHTPSPVAPSRPCVPPAHTASTRSTSSICIHPHLRCSVGRCCERRPAACSYSKALRHAFHTVLPGGFVASRCNRDVTDMHVLQDREPGPGGNRCRCKCMQGIIACSSPTLSTITSIADPSRSAAATTL